MKKLHKTLFGFLLGTMTLCTIAAIITPGGGSSLVNLTETANVSSTFSTNLFVSGQLWVTNGIFTSTSTAGQLTLNWGTGLGGMTNYGGPMIWSNAAIASGAFGSINTNGIITSTNPFTGGWFGTPTNPPASGKFIGFAGGTNTSWQTPSGAAGPANAIMGGNATVTYATAAPKYVNPFGGAVVATESQVSIAAPSSCTLTNFNIRMSTLGSGTNCQWYIMTNGTPSNMKIELIGAGSAIASNSLSQFVTCVAGTTISIMATGNNASIGAGQHNWSVQVY